MTGVFVGADESKITILNLTDPTLSSTARRAMQEAASKAPEKLGAVLNGEEFVYDNLRVSQVGVFLRDQKLGKLKSIVTRIARTDVVRVERDRMELTRRAKVVIGVASGIAGFLLILYVANSAG